MNQPFIIERTFQAPIKKVWEAITDREKMKEWYFDIEEFKPVAGFEFQFTGGDNVDTYVHLCKITEVVPGKKLSYTWQYKGLPGLSYLTFELFDEGDGTRLKLTHEGLETFHQNGHNFRKESFMQGWTEIIGTSLKTFLEKTAAEKVS